MIGVVGPGVERVEHVASLPGVEQVIRVTKPYKLASREHHPDRTRVRVRRRGRRGGRALADDGRPVRGRVARAAHGDGPLGEARGRVALRGGAFKPRTSPYAFQGLGVEGLKLLARGP